LLLLATSSLDWYEALLRLALAGVLGGMIGLERSCASARRARTHLLVAVGAALFTIVGAYGFAAGRRTDPTRIAAQSRHRHRLPRRRGDHPPGLLDSRPDHRGDAVGRRRGRSRSGRGLLQRRRHLHGTRAACSVAAPNRRLPDPHRFRPRTAAAGRAPAGVTGQVIDELGAQVRASRRSASRRRETAAGSSWIWSCRKRHAAARSRARRGRADVADVRWD
jgi:hypothetical protein